MITRRNFVKGAAAAGGLMFLPSCATNKVKNANGKMNIAVIGAGGMGGAIFNYIKGANNVNVVAICDVDRKRAAKAIKDNPSIPFFEDYRVMFDKMGNQIDGVTVSTPDHMHYPQSAWAIANGKHVFCQKPLTRTIWEAEELKRLAKEAGVFTQMGNQGHTNEGWRLIKEWYEAGILGEVEDIYVWTNRPIWPQGDLKMPAGEKVPSTLNYKLWLGVAPYQPYSHDVVPFNWRGMRNYGTGACGDMACHFLDVPYSAFGLNFPISVKANSTPFNDYSWPKQSSAEMVFANKCGVNGKITLHWYDGGRKPKAIKGVDEAFLKDRRNANCTFIVGTKCTVHTNEYGMPAATFVYPKSKMREMLMEAKKNGKDGIAEKKYDRSQTPDNPVMEWVNACIAGKQPNGNFDYAAPFTEMCLLNMIAINFPNRELVYNPSKLAFANCPEADKYVRSLYAYNKEFLPSSIF